MDSLRIAKRLYVSEVHQAHMLATFIFGRLAARSLAALNFLRCRVSKDEDWRVQEILAQAFEKYCAEIDYEQALPVIEDWLARSAKRLTQTVRPLNVLSLFQQGHKLL